MMTTVFDVVSKFDLIFNQQQVQTKKRPDLSVQLSKAQSAKEVADGIQSAWITYGASDIVANADGSYTFTITGQDMETFDGAMKYLWFKTSKSDPGTYTMSKLPYKVMASKSDNVIEVTVMGKDVSV